MHRGRHSIIHPRPIHNRPTVVHRPIVAPRTIVGAVVAATVVHSLVHPRPKPMHGPKTHRR
ncbi:MAG: hypothetical protein R3Y60_04000 [bacterium]